MYDGVELKSITAQNRQSYINVNNIIFNFTNGGINYGNEI
jgi:hypothetical protein|tara:strand:+ start:300 stop:419 length:120 start_codon:yes stop_codon:yes gene_type:complete